MCLLPRIPTNLEERTAQRSVVATFVGCARPINKNNVCPFSPLAPFSPGFDHLKLIVRNQGLDARLTGAAGSVIDEWIA